MSVESKKKKNIFFKVTKKIKQLNCTFFDYWEIIDVQFNDKLN